MLQKVINASGFYAHGRSVFKYAQGRIGGIDRLNVAGPTADPYFPTGFYNSQVMNGPQRSWAYSGLVSTGTVIFNNAIEGGSLENLVVFNKGPGDVRIGLNSTDVTSTSGTILLSGSGSNISYGSTLISHVFAIPTAGSSGIIETQGLFRA